MALVLDETFTTMPAGFATNRNDGTAGTSTWDGVNFAVNLVAGSSWMLYDITSQALRSTGEVEVVIENIADPGLLDHMGLWLFTGSGAISNGVRFHHYFANGSVNPSRWTVDMYNAPSVFGGGAVNLETFYNAGVQNLNNSGYTRTLNIRWDTNAAAGRATAEFRLEGLLVGITGQALPGNLRPGLGCYLSTLRLHSIKVWDAPQVAMTVLGATNKGAAPRVVSTGWQVPQEASGAPKSRGLPPASGSVDMSVPEQDTMNNPRSRGFADNAYRKSMAPPEQLTTTGQVSKYLGFTLGRNTVGAVQSIAPGYPNAVYQGKTLAIRNMFQGGQGRIGGTIKEKSSPDNKPVYRKVILFDEQNMQLVRTAWSDKLTGAYSFDYVNEYHTYSVFAYDHTGGYRAVIANNQIPVIIP